MINEALPQGVIDEDRGPFVKSLQKETILVLEQEFQRFLFLSVRIL